MKNERQYFPINEELAKRAHDMMSMRDYPEGSKTAEYKGYVDKAYGLAERIAKERPKQTAKAWKIAVAYARRMADNLNASSRIGTMCPSILIVGGSNFPVRTKEKQNAASDRNCAEFTEIQSYISKLERILYGKESIRADDDEAIILLEEKISCLEARQKFMKAVNAYFRKHKTLDGCLELTDEIRWKIEAGWAKGWYVGIPFPTYELSNNNANIKRTRGRLENLKQEKSRVSSEREINGLGFSVKENVDLMRLQLFFEDKPEPEVRDILKHRGFKWSPRNGCWQRQLNDNARYALRHLLEELR